ncbi:SURF1 family protein [Agrococcus sp. SL85]|uniref:SURF1 family cytochrome oxidase biogenesis protein n=1 Tax=Agrococcus sp. SL85 TaxID=2995141 RepID=UPI00226D36A9|nr:SURF1 family cytochrome oxidase biogenesis protein [Agrococcus sp. SL85]WAC66621.1 SURF1 family protein [Agrococcus sp. SL85]
MSASIPTFRQVAARPRWIGVLIGCLLVSGIFALLGQWQIERAVEQGQRDERDTETAVPLGTMAQPGEPLTTEAGGRMVSLIGDDTADYRALAGRNQDGRSGWWIIGRVLVEDDGAPAADLPADAPGASLAVAYGWTADEASAREEAAAMADDAGTVGAAPVVGRYLPAEAPTDGDVRGRTNEAMSVAALVNEWQDWDGRAYTGYLVLDPEASGARVVGDEPIVSRPPEQNTQLNWLNVFYAIEWVAFMGFALYLWYRLVKDARERDIEAIEEAEEAAAARADAPAPHPTAE